MPPPFNALINAIWCAKTENSLMHTILDGLLTVQTVNIFQFGKNFCKNTFEMMKTRNSKTEMTFHR